MDIILCKKLNDVYVYYDFLSLPAISLMPSLAKCLGFFLFDNSWILVPYFMKHPPKLVSKKTKPKHRQQQTPHLNSP